MSKWKCNSCGATYSDTLADGSPFAHACSPEVIEHAKCDETGKVVEPEKRTPRAVIRNENLQPGILFLDGKPHTRKPHPEERGQTVLVPCGLAIISEGAGRTLVE